MNKPLVIAMMGLPRSGKSTVARGLAHQLRAPIVNKDAIRLALYDKRYWGPGEPMVRGIADVMLKALIGAGHGIVIVDETHYSKAARATVKSNDWVTRFYHVATPPEVCKERAIATGQPDLIPIIDEMVSRYEPLDESEWLYP